VNVGVFSAAAAWTGIEAVRSSAATVKDAAAAAGAVAPVIPVDERDGRLAGLLE